MQISLQNRDGGLTIEAMSSGRVFRFAPTPERRPNHLFVFLHGCGATAQSMIPIAFKFQARFPSAALVVPSGFDPDARGGAAQDWYPTRGLNCDNHRARVAAVLPYVEDLVRREQTNFGVAASRTVLIGFSQGGTVALEAVKSPNVAGAVVAFSSRFAQNPGPGCSIRSRIHLVHGAFDSVVSRVYAERAARAKTRFPTGSPGWVKSDDIVGLKQPSAGLFSGTKFTIGPVKGPSQ